MPTVHAVYEDGVFRPLDEVDLPDRAEVEFEPRLVQPTNGRDEVYAVLSESFDTGESDLAARHNEHQP